MIRYFNLKNPWWNQKRFNFGILRPKYTKLILKSIGQRLIQILTGLRRVGKSTISLQLIHSLIEDKKVNPKRIFMFSIEEPSLSKLPIIEIINEYRAEHGIKSKEKIYVFIDEIQFRENWEQEIKSLYDTEQIKFILTGSSAMLLSNKISFLTGRYLKTQIHALDFSEYLQFKKIQYSKVDEYLFIKHLENYLLEGGMPEFVLTHPDRYLETTVESILFKDLVSKFEIRNPKILLDLIYLLSDRVGSTISSLKLSKVLAINKDTILSYLDYLNKIFLTKEILNYSTSRNKEIYNPPKIYFEDNGILSTYSSKVNLGALAENAVLLKLKEISDSQKRTKLGYWYEAKKEIDFILEFNQKKYAFESKWIDKKEDLDLQNMQRLLQEMKVEKLYLITRLLQGSIRIDKQNIIFLPLYKFLTKQFEF